MWASLTVQGSSGVCVLGAGTEVTMGTWGEVGQREEVVTFFDSLTRDQG